MPRQSVASAVARQEQENQPLEAVRQQVREARGWFDRVIPSHVDADQFVAIGLGLLSKDPYLAEAAARNPTSFMVALSECARLGLIPGDGYALVVFKNTETGVPDIVGMTEYTGELELIYRTGRVRTVIAEIVWTNDTFARGAHPHDPPTFFPAGRRFPKASQRGEPEGGFAYAVFPDGSASRVIYMDVEEVMLHRKAARTKKVWDGDFWRSMWLKTFVHELFKWVPKSPEYLAAAMRVLAAGEPDSLPPGSLQKAIEPDYPLADMPLPLEQRGPAAGGEHAAPPEPRAVRRRRAAEQPPGDPQTAAEPPGATAGTPVTKETLDAITGHLEHFGCMSREDRLHAVSVLAGRWVTKPNELTADEGDRVKIALATVAEHEGADPATDFQEVIMLQARAWSDANPQAFEGQTE